MAEDSETIETGTEQIRCQLEARVASLTLHRPEARNALTLEMKQALARLVPALGSDSRVGCLLLTGAGGAFCAGGDTKLMAREGSRLRPRSASGSCAGSTGSSRRSTSWRSRRWRRCRGPRPGPASRSRSPATCGSPRRAPS